MLLLVLLFNIEKYFSKMIILKQQLFLHPYLK
nr:MAG TPA: hypothetical protein [Caudoviricetes sp.]